MGCFSSRFPGRAQERLSEMQDETKDLSTALTSLFVMERKGGRKGGRGREGEGGEGEEGHGSTLPSSAASSAPSSPRHSPSPSMSLPSRTAPSSPERKRGEGGGGGEGGREGGREGGKGVMADVGNELAVVTEEITALEVGLSPPSLCPLPLGLSAHSSLSPSRPPRLPLPVHVHCPPSRPPSPLPQDEVQHTSRAVARHLSSLLEEASGKNKEWRESEGEGGGEEEKEDEGEEGSSSSSLPLPSKRRCASMSAEELALYPAQCQRQLYLKVGREGGKEGGREGGREGKREGR